MENLIIIGAGFTAAALTRFLNEKDPLIIDKGRGAGGRCSSRRVEDIGVFDHGLQYVSSENNDFIEFLKDGLKENLLSWNGEFYNEKNELNKSQKFIGKNGNNEFVKKILKSKNQIYKTKVEKLIFKNNHWQVILNGNKSIDTKKVIVTIPEEQCCDLLKDVYDIHYKNQTISNLTLMVAIKNNKNTFSGKKIKDKEDVISWIANENSKNRDLNNSSLSLYTVQSTEKFAEKNCSKYYTNKEIIMKEMLNRFLNILHLENPEVKYCSIHSWRLAYKKNNFSNKVIWDQKKGLGICGDWISGPKLENSWENSKKFSDIYNNS